MNYMQEQVVSLPMVFIHLQVINHASPLQQYLEQILYNLQEAGVSSPYYLYLPNTISDLIFHRRVDSDAEIGSLCLLPADSANISKEFLEDMNRILV